MQDITSAEEKFLRSLLVRIRQDFEQGQRWRQIFPQFMDADGDMVCGSPISVPSSLFKGKPVASVVKDDEIDYGATKPDLDETDTADSLGSTPLLPAPDGEIDSGDFPDPPVKHTRLRQVVLEMFARTKQRMSGGEIHHTLNERKHRYSESAVQKVLCYMVNVSKELSNIDDSHGKGYGPTNWA